MVRNDAKTGFSHLRSLNNLPESWINNHSHRECHLIDWIEWRAFTAGRIFPNISVFLSTYRKLSPIIQFGTESAGCEKRIFSIFAPSRSCRQMNERKPARNRCEDEFFREIAPARPKSHPPFPNELVLANRSPSG